MDELALVSGLLQAPKRCARTALGVVPNRIWERLFPKDVLALGYHMVSDEDVSHLRLYRHKTARQFEADVAFAQERTVRYADVVQHRLAGMPMAANGFLFTFDDGFAECFHVVRPILKRYGVSAVFFITTDFIDDRSIFFETIVSLCVTAIESASDEQLRDAIRRMSTSTSIQSTVRGRELFAMSRIARPPSGDRRHLLLLLLSLQRDAHRTLEQLCEIFDINPERYVRNRPIFMSAEQLRTLAADGFTLGAHGLDHRLLTGMDPAAIEREIVVSCDNIRTISGQARVPFAFPYSGRGVDRDLLAGIMTRYPFIEVFFDSGPLRAGAPFVIDRVWAENPIDADARTNLPLLMRHAWTAPSAWRRSV